MDEYFYQTVYDEVVNLDSDKLIKMRREGQEQKTYKKLIQLKRLELDKNQRALAKIMEGYEDGDYSKQEFIDRKQLRERAIAKINKEIHELETILGAVDQKYSEDDIIKLIRKRWLNLSNANEQNQLLRTIVDRINYDREGDMVYLDVRYK